MTQIQLSLAVSTAIYACMLMHESSAFVQKGGVTCFHGVSGYNRVSTHISQSNNDNSNEDLPIGGMSDEYTGSVDWDAEWKKVVKKGAAKSENRPGKEFYKSEAEIAAIQAANKATEQATKIASKIPATPSFNELKGDWKFWVGIIAAISVASSLLAGAATQSPPLPTNGSADSFYI